MGSWESEIRGRSWGKSRGGPRCCAASSPMGGFSFDNSEMSQITAPPRKKCGVVIKLHFKMVCHLKMGSQSCVISADDILHHFNQL